MRYLIKQQAALLLLYQQSPYSSKEVTGHLLSFLIESSHSGKDLFLCTQVEITPTVSQPNSMLSSAAHGLCTTVSWKPDAGFLHGRETGARCDRWRPNSDRQLAVRSAVTRVGGCSEFVVSIRGHTLPSRSSRDAPPPVEMWLILSARPAFSTAATESPPPMMVMVPCTQHTCLISVNARFAKISFAPAYTQRPGLSIIKWPGAL